MRKWIIIGLTVLLLLLTLFTNFKHKDNKQTITVAEVTHSIFYAPFYVAIENGYFEEENLDIDLILTPGADNFIYFNKNFFRNDSFMIIFFYNPIFFILNNFF